MSYRNYDRDRNVRHYDDEDRYDREDYGGYGPRRYSELRPQGRRYDRADYADERNERRYRREGYGGYDPNYPTLYGEQESRYQKGQTARGAYRGVGPRGYQRSDQRIWEDINERLTQDDEIEASSVEVMIDRGEVTLTGTADSRREKRRIEDVVESVSGVRDIINQLRVRMTGEKGRERQDGGRVLDVVNDVRGKTVLRTYTGEKLGEVSDVIVHPTEGRMLGLALRGPDGSERALVVRDFVIGNDAVMASENANMDEEGMTGMLSEGVPASRNITGASVVTEDGNLIGRISQVFISRDTHRVIYRVAESRLKQLIGGGFYIPGDAVRAYSPDGGRIIVPVDIEDRAVSSIGEAINQMESGSDRSADIVAQDQPGETQPRSRTTTTRTR